MKYLSNEIISEALGKLKKIASDSDGKSALERTSALRYFLAYLELSRSLSSSLIDLSTKNKTNRKNFTDAVGHVVEIENNGTYTSNFSDINANFKDYAVGNNFLTTRLKKDTDYPGRPAPLLRIENEKISLHPNGFENLKEFGEWHEYRVYLGIWLCRNFKFEHKSDDLADISDQILEKLKDRYGEKLTSYLFHDKKEELHKILSSYDEMKVLQETPASILSELDDPWKIEEEKILPSFLTALSSSGLIFDSKTLTRFVASMLSKPFVILTGLSGSGKTKLAQAFVQWICNKGSSNQTSDKFNFGEELNGQRVNYKVTQCDLYSVTFTQTDSNTKVALPYELIYEWIDVIRKNDFDALTPTRQIRDLVGQNTKYSTQLNSFESHLKVAAFELISRKNKNDQSNSQYLVVAVGADWTNREPLLGYPNALEPGHYAKPDSGVLDLIIRANSNPDLPFFLILDEMNLSHVERYFADFLSSMESKEPISLHSEGQVENGVPSKLSIPSNLFIIGTVNIDETTNMFSPKVLDRANTIEFRVTQDEMKIFLGSIKEIDMKALNAKGASMAKRFVAMSADKSFANKDLEAINDTLVQFFGELKKTGAEFGYRTASEILRLIYHLGALDPSLETKKKVDIAIMQKLLPKLHGSQRKLKEPLAILGSLCIEGKINISQDVFENPSFDYYATNVLYPISLEKIARMYKGAIANGFTSFAEA